MSFALHPGDCLDVLATLDAHSADAVITDPPAGIGFMGRDWDHHRGGRDAWIRWLAARLEAARRVVRPGGWMLCWALPRTSHWTALAIESAGWTIRDRISHLFGTGFPKSRSCLKPACEDWWLCKAPGPLRPLEVDAGRIGTAKERPGGKPRRAPQGPAYGDLSQDDGTGSGWKTDLGRWPANVCLSHYEDCRPLGTRRVRGSGKDGEAYRTKGYPCPVYAQDRWTQEERRRSDISHVDPDGLETIDAYECVEGCPVRLLGEQGGEGRSRGNIRYNSARLNIAKGAEADHVTIGYSGAGTAARFFYTSKASREDRDEGNSHPTVKSTDLMRWLCRLVTPAGGTVLDPFAGSGSTGKACMIEGFRFVGVESDPESFATATRRITAAAKASMRVVPEPTPAMPVPTGNGHARDVTPFFPGFLA